MSYQEKLKHPSWQKKRLEILQRDEFRCKFCGETEKQLHVHHIAYTGKDPWDIDNKLLVSLCSDCHEFETEAIKDSSNNLIKTLKLKGYTSFEISELAGAFECSEIDLTGDTLIFAAIFHKLKEPNFLEDIRIEYWQYLESTKLENQLDKDITF